MTKHNEINERMKRDYFTYLKEAKRQSEQSIDAVAMALARFEDYTKRRDFKKFHPQQAVAFKRQLAEQISKTTGEKLSKSTVRSTLAALRNFFAWLSCQPGYRKHFTAADADYFNPSDRDGRIALTSQPRPVPTLEQVQHVLASMPAETEVNRRDRALVAFILLTGCRDRAVVTLKLKHVDLSQSVVFQDARQVQTKFGKSITTYFFPVGDDARKIFSEWIAELTTQHLWGLDDPLFPATLIAPSAARLFHAAGIERRHWSNADPVRRIFKTAFENAGLPYHNPHSFRNLLSRHGQQLCKTPEDYKAWSQNLGHESVLTTFTSYGHIDEHRQGEIISALSDHPTDYKEAQDLLQRLAAIVGR